VYPAEHTKEFFDRRVFERTMDNVVALSSSHKKQPLAQHPASTVKPEMKLDFTKILTQSSYLETFVVKTARGKHLTSVSPVR